jgi:hypothetical protein
MIVCKAALAREMKTLFGREQMDRRVGMIQGDEWVEGGTEFRGEGGYAFNGGGRETRALRSCGRGDRAIH